MPRQSPAERYRAHRMAFELALELGITPREAEEEIARRAARDRWKQAEKSLRNKQSHHHRASFEQWDAPHMMRD